MITSVNINQLPGSQM